MANRRSVAVIPTNGGLGFAVLEGHDLLDWGVKHARNAWLADSLTQVHRLIAQYQPSSVVLERQSGSLRRARVRDLITRIATIARGSKVGVRELGWPTVRERLCGTTAATKEVVARAVVERFPELRPRLPQPRKPWMSEDVRMAIFDAVAFGVTHLARVARRRSDPDPQVA